MASIMTNSSKTERHKLTYRRVWGVIEKYRSIRQMTIDVLAIKVHCSDQTVRNRGEKPHALSLEEMMKYKEALEIPDLELAEAITGKKLLLVEELRIGS